MTRSGYLVVLAADGTPLHDIPLPNPGSNGNGNGAPAAPSVGDLDGDGAHEVEVPAEVAQVADQATLMG